MTPEEMYLTERLDVQIAHFLKKSVQHRRRYKVLKITEIVAGFLIAVFCAIPMPGDRYRLISDQKTAQLLEREKFLYQCQTEKYAGKTKAFALFVKTCEGLISEEINQWESIQSKEVATSAEAPGQKE